MRATRKTLGLYYGLSGLNRLGYSFIFATYAIFLMKRGMSLFDLNLINSIYFVTVIVAEIPTGAVADVFGRKKSFVMAAVFYSAAMFVYYFSHSFTGFCLAEVLAALGATLWSGTFQAWLVDRFKYFGSRKPLFPYFARVSQIELGAGILGSLGGGYMANYDLSASWLVAGGIFLICGLLAALLMKENYFRARKLVLKNSLLKYSNIVKVSWSIGTTNKTVRFLMLLGFVLWFAEQAPNMQWQPFFQKDLQTNSEFGWISSGISVAMIIGAQIAGFLVTFWKSEKRAIVFTTLMMATAIALSGLMKSFPAALGIFLFFELLRGAYRPLTDTLINREIPSRERTTVLSFANMLFSIGGWLGLVLSGLLAEHISIPYAWLVSGFVLFAATLWLGRKSLSRTNTG